MKLSKIIAMTSLATALCTVPSFAGNGKGPNGGNRSGGCDTTQCDGTGQQVRAQQGRGQGQGTGEARRERARQRAGDCPDSAANRAESDARTADRPARR